MSYNMLKNEGGGTYRLHGDNNETIPALLNKLENIA